MKRASMFITIAFVAGVGIGFFARSTVLRNLPRRDTHAADLAAIEKLHKADVDATMTQDLSALTTLWSDDAINLGFPGSPVVGIKAMKEAYEKFQAEHPDFKVLKYANDVRDVQILDCWAIEVGYSEATFKMSAKDNPVVVPRTLGMRVLKKQSDGSWKFAVVGVK